MMFLYDIICKCMHLLNVFAASIFPTKGHVYMLHWVSDEVMHDEKEPFRISVLQFNKFLSRINNKIIKLEDWESNNSFCAITIDDVPESFYVNAYPILKEQNIPFTIFVNVSLLDTGGYITREQLQEMSECECCTVGSHGINHIMYAGLSREEALKELKGSKEILESIIKGKVNIYAFPYGSYYACGFRNKKIATQVYKYAFGTVGCPVTKPMMFKNYFLPRINVDTKYIDSMSLVPKSFFD